MLTHKLLQFIQAQTNRLDKLHSNGDTQRVVLYNTIKLMEEVGELSSEVLANYAIQRKEKLEKHSPESLANEFADVIITTLILAQRMNIDISTALDKKVAEIEKRFGV